MRAPLGPLAVFVAAALGCADATAPDAPPSHFELEALAEGRLGGAVAECDITVLFTVVSHLEDGWRGTVQGTMKRVLTRGEDISALRVIVEGQASMAQEDGRVRITFDGVLGDPFLGALATEVVGRQVSAGPPLDYLGTWSCAAFALPIGPFGDPAQVAPGDWRMRALE